MTGSTQRKDRLLCYDLVLGIFNFLMDQSLEEMTYA